MPSILRFVAIGVIVLLAACGGQPTTSGAPQPTQPTAPTQPPEATAAPQPTQPPEATAAPQPTQPPEATATPPVKVIKVTPEATSQTTSSLGDVLVILHVTGGFAGVDETLTVYTDERLEFSGRGGKKTAHVAPSELATLQKLLSSPEFAALDAQYPDVAPDAFVYELTVPGGQQPRTVVTADGAKNPPVLNQVLVELNKLRQQVK
ncbi:MAG: hypothetical protein ACJ8CR_19480 [Roseiflexaceae bacterium]